MKSTASGYWRAGAPSLSDGAYLRPAYRGRRLTPAMLDATLRDYAGQGLASYAVNFKSFNPEAALFWPRYF